MKKTGVFDSHGIELQAGDIVRNYAFSKEGVEVEIEAFGSRIPGAFTYRPVGAVNAESSYLLGDLVKSKAKFVVVHNIDNYAKEQDMSYGSMFHRIKEMDVADLAVYLVRLQTNAIDRYQNGFYPPGIFETIDMLKKREE